MGQFNSLRGDYQLFLTTSLLLSKDSEPDASSSFLPALAILSFPLTAEKATQSQQLQLLETRLQPGLFETSLSKALWDRTLHYTAENPKTIVTYASVGTGHFCWWLSRGMLKGIIKWQGCDGTNTWFHLYGRFVVIGPNTISLVR